MPLRRNALDNPVGPRSPERTVQNVVMITDVLTSSIPVHTVIVRTSPIVDEFLFSCIDLRPLVYIVFATTLIFATPFSSSYRVTSPHPPRRICHNKAKDPLLPFSSPQKKELFLQLLLLSVISRTPTVPTTRRRHQIPYPSTIHLNKINLMIAGSVQKNPTTYWIYQ